MASLAAMWDQLVDAICRPPRDDAYTAADLVGGTTGVFTAGGSTFRRTDHSIEGPVAGSTLSVSLYEPLSPPPPPSSPAVVYAHCNSGSRRDADEVLGLLLPRGAAVVAVDCRGSGLSSGDVVSLGLTEAADIDAVLAWLPTVRPATARVALWGRSMGAVAALLCAAQGKEKAKVSALVLDSPFASLPDLLRDLATSRALPVPRLLTAPALALMRRSVRRRAGFDVRAVAPIDAVAAATAPALFGHADADSFIPVAHTHRLHAAYGGERALMTFGGDHNSARPPAFRSAAASFLDAALGTSPAPVSFAPASVASFAPDPALLATVAAFDAAVVAGGAPTPGAAAAAHAAAEAAFRTDDVERLMVEEAVRLSLADAAPGTAALGPAAARRASASGGARGAAAASPAGMTPDQRALAAFFAGGEEGPSPPRGGWPSPVPAVDAGPAPPPRRLVLPKAPPKGKGGPTVVRASSATEGG